MPEENPAPSPYYCSHDGFLEIRKKPTTSGCTFWYHCQNCGELVRRISAKDIADVNLIIEVDEKIRGNFYQRVRDKQDRERAAEAQRWWADYNAYLKSPEWAEKRRLVIARANGICEGCRKNKATAVHHLTYDRVFCEMLFDLVAICRECHSRIHTHLA